MPLNFPNAEIFFFFFKYTWDHKIDFGQDNWLTLASDSANQTVRWLHIHHFFPSILMLCPVANHFLQGVPQGSREADFTPIFGSQLSQSAPSSALDTDVGCRVDVWLKETQSERTFTLSLERLGKDALCPLLHSNEEGPALGATGSLKGSRPSNFLGILSSWWIQLYLKPMLPLASSVTWANKFPQWR